MEGAKFNQTPAGYDTYVGDPSHAIQHGGDEAQLAGAKIHVFGAEIKEIRNARSVVLVSSTSM